MRLVLKCSLAGLLLAACNSPAERQHIRFVKSDTTVAVMTVANITADKKTGILPGGEGITLIETGTTTPAQLLAFANTLQGVPYKYASVNPKEGFDCSGFITYVFNHFDIAVPRSSIGFTDVEREIPLTEAKPGDLILFTGTDSTIRRVGHMGIFLSQPGSPRRFIHSTSGKAWGVTITPLNPYYMGRYMKTIRIFRQNN